MEYAIIIVNPAISPKNGSFVVVDIKHNYKPLLRQLVTCEKISLLKSLNTKYPIIKVANNLKIYGVVTEVVIELIG